MIPSEKFRWSLRILRLQYQLASQNIFVVNFKRGYGFWFLSLIWNSALVFYILMLWNHQLYDIKIVLCVMGAFLGVFQVGRWTSEKIISTSNSV